MTRLEDLLATPTTYRPESTWPESTQTGLCLKAWLVTEPHPANTAEWLIHYDMDGVHLALKVMFYVGASDDDMVYASRNLLDFLSAGESEIHVRGFEEVV